MARRVPVDPITLGFEQLNARFDKLDHRVESLERPHATNKDLDDSEFDEADQEWEEYRRANRRDRYLEDQPFNPRGRGRGRYNRGGRGDRFGGGGYQGRGACLHRRDDREVRMNRRRDNWDPPQYRQDAWGDDDEYDDRAPTCWDPPQRRGRYNRPQYDQLKDVKMKAPHFDGSDAANWISRVQYYFNHKMIPEADR